MTRGTDVIAVHLSHHCPPDLESRLLRLGALGASARNQTSRARPICSQDDRTAIGKRQATVWANADVMSANSCMAGYNLRLLPIIQSMSQLDATYGKDVSRTLITNHALQIVFAPREQQDANDYSDMLGYTTVRKENITRGRETSRSHSEERRALMLPQELKAMGPDKEVFLYEGIPHPVKCDKIRYYKDRYFTSRLLPKVDVPMLNV